MKPSITDNDSELFNSFVGYIVDNRFLPEYALLPDLSFKDTNYSNANVTTFYKNKEQLLTNAAKAITFSDYLKIRAQFSEFEQSVRALPNLQPDFSKNLVDIYSAYINNLFKYHSLQQFVIWLGTYCIFKKRYNLIQTLLFYNQPKDSPVYWSNTDINPLNYGEILNLSIRQHELDKSITFLWDGHYEFSVYFRQYIAILFINAIYQNSIKSSWRNTFNPDYLSDNKNKQEIENIIHFIKEIKNSISNLHHNKTIIEACGLSLQAAEKSIEFLNNIIDYLKHKAEIITATQNIDSQKQEIFINNIYDYYSNGGALKNIIKHYNAIETNIEQLSENKLISISTTNNLLKSFLAENDDGMYVNFPQGIATQLLYYENYNLLRIYAQSSITPNKNIDQSNLVNFLNSLENIASKVLIFINVYPSYEIFNSQSGFVPREAILDENKINIFEFAGCFQSADVFSFYEDSNIKYLLVIEKTQDNNIGVLKYYKPDDSNNFVKKEPLFWQIINLLENESEIEKIIIEQPTWLMQEEPDKTKQIAHLKKCILLNIKIKLDLELPENFKSWFIRFK